MSDPIHFLTGWTAFHSRRVMPTATAAQIIRQDPLWFSERMIAKHELRIWFEPDWRNARYLARRFPRCLICSIPPESDTPARHRVPGWRSRRPAGVL
jgi:hypothetical protein